MSAFHFLNVSQESALVGLTFVLVYLKLSVSPGLFFFKAVSEQNYNDIDKIKKIAC